MPFLRDGSLLEKEYIAPWKNSPNQILHVLVHPIVVCRSLVQVMIDFFVPRPDPDGGREDDDGCEQHTEVLPGGVLTEDC